MVGVPMRPGPLKNFMMRLMGTRASEWFGLNVGGDIDKWLLTRSNGRVALLVGWPIGLLETHGAKTGALRTNPLMYLEDDGRLVLVGSKGGDPAHPGWVHNIRANPEVRFRWKGRNERLVARIAQPHERAELWPKILELYPGYADYQARASGRTIPLVILEAPR